ncbi:MAG: ArsR family transcriptional regulator [Halobacteriaceae archaeon]
MSTDTTGSTAGVGSGGDQLAVGEVHDILSNSRRRHLIERLQSHGEQTLRELSERIAAAETGQQPPPADARQSVYVSLQQTHLPRLERLDVVEYDEADHAVRPAANAEDVAVYMEVVQGNEITRNEYYGLLAALGLVAVAGAAVGVPGLAAVGPGAVGAATLALVSASATYFWYASEPL